MDIKDKRILYELSKNSRLPASQIAKKAGISKDSVIYRMANLERLGIIKEYMTVVNLKAFGYRTHILFLEFRKFDIREEKKIIKMLVENPHTIWVGVPSGRWDVIADVISKDTDQFNEILMEILNNMGSNLKHYELMETVKEFYYNHKYLTDGNQIKTIPKSIEYSVDETDFLILKELSQNSRMNSTEISSKVGLSHDAVSYRIKKMIKSGIIEQFTVQLDFSKMGYSYYYIFLGFGAVKLIVL